MKEGLVLTRNLLARGRKVRSLEQNVRRNPTTGRKSDPGELEAEERSEGPCRKGELQSFYMFLNLPIEIGMSKMRHFLEDFIYVPLLPQSTQIFKIPICSLLNRLPDEVKSSIIDLSRISLDVSTGIQMCTEQCPCCIHVPHVQLKEHSMKGLLQTSVSLPLALRSGPTWEHEQTPSVLSHLYLVAVFRQGLTM